MNLYGVGIFLIGAATSTVVTVIFGPFVEQIASRILGGFLPGGDSDLRGRWCATYQYSSSGESKTGVQIIKLTQIGRTVYGKNVGGDSPHKDVLRLHVNGDWATGTWRNIVRGARHHGVLQLRMAANGNSMKGRWLGSIQTRPSKKAIRYGNALLCKTL